VRGATQVEVILAGEETEDPADATPQELQRRIYLRSIGVLKGVFHEMRRKDRFSTRRVKRVVQEMIEKLELDPGYMLNLTSVKNYDEYTFNHSVNVGVLAIALGRSVGLSRRQLYVVGQAGMLHDIGKLCVPNEILNKPGALAPEERQRMQSHPVEGFLSIASKQGVSADTIAVTLAAYEHHLNPDGSGYPPPAAARSVGLLSRLVAIVDRYDAMTSARVYRSQPIPPPRALAMMYQAHAGAVDRTLLAYFMNMLGTYPIGTTVRLSDSSVGVVVSAADDPELWHLPSVRIVVDADGVQVDGDVVDLGADAKGSDSLRVVETLNAADYGIQTGDLIL
jgi:HD-GYP domain-containing protein (c-di-GMP phosphodiesterase class II)